LKFSRNLKNEIETKYSNAKVYPVKLDVSNPDQVRNLVKGLPKEVQQVDILVNNAGLVKGFDKVGEIAEEDVKVMFDTNVTGLINMTQAILPAMKSRNTGTIINIGSIAGRDPYAGGSIYCATKIRSSSLHNQSPSRTYFDKSTSR